MPIGAENTAGFQTSFTPFLFHRTGTISTKDDQPQPAHIELLSVGTDRPALRMAGP